MITGWLMRTPSPLWGEGEDASCRSVVVWPEGGEDKSDHDEAAEME